VLQCLAVCCSVLQSGEHQHVSSHTHQRVRSHTPLNPVWLGTIYVRAHANTSAHTCIKYICTSYFCWNACGEEVMYAHTQIHTHTHKYTRTHMHYINVYIQFLLECVLGKVVNFKFLSGVGRNMFWLVRTVKLDPLTSQGQERLLVLVWADESLLSLRNCSCRRSFQCKCIYVRLIYVFVYL